MAADPSVTKLVATVFGKADPDTIATVMATDNRTLVHKQMLAAPKKALRLARPRPAVAPRPVAPPAPPAPPAPASVQAATPDPTKVGKADVDLVVTCEFSKIDTDERTVFGWASVSEIDGKVVLDRQGDMVDIVDLSKSVYDYVIDSRHGGHQHRRTEEDGLPLKVSDMIESMVFTKEKIERMGLPEATPLGWWVGYRVADDQVWEEVKDGRLTGFSVHGKGKRIPVGT